MKLGIVGMGFVGKAVFNGMRHKFIINTYDIALAMHSTCDSLSELVNKSDIIFVCLPTPMKDTGECDTSIVCDTITDIKKYANGRYKLIIVKSTVPPNTLQSLDDPIFPNIVFNPEFLTEANFLQDFENQTHIILGGEPLAVSMATHMYRAVFAANKVQIIQTNINTAIMAKYVTNTFLATKVAFANEMYQICDAMGVQYSNVTQILGFDHRMGQTHWKVPGPDGHFGFGGSCFPKDINGLMYEAEHNDVNPSILRAVWQKNLEVRPEQDWKELKGRAVV